MSFRNVRILTLLVAALLMTTGLFAQTSTSGAITGTVRDANGPVPGVTVEVKSPTLQGSKVEVSDAKGQFRFSLLPPGTYTLTANLSGYSPVKQTDVQVGLGRTVTLDVTMNQAVSEQITVVAAAPVVDTQSTTTGANVTSEMFQSLPVARNFYSVAQIAPGTNADASGTTFYGSTGAENQYIIDGLNTTGIETGTEGKQLNFDFIQEVEVKTGGLPAEYGRITGGIVNAITKSGGNEFHGSVFGYTAGGGLRSNNSTATDRPATTTTIGDVDTQYDWGATLGGYFVKDRLWFFGAYDRTNETDTREIIRPLSTPGSPAVGDVIPTDTTRDLYSGKLTFRLNDNNTINASIFGDPSKDEGAIFGIAGPASTWEGTNKTGGIDYIARYAGIFTGTWLVNASLGKHHEETTVGGAGVDTPLYIDATVVPNGLSGGFGFYQNQTFDRDVYKLDISKFLSSHDVKFGGDFEDISAVNNNFNGGAGQRIYKFKTSGGTVYYRHRYYVNDQAPGFNISDPTTWQIAAPLTSEPETKNYSAYIQDAWKIMPNFTLNLGIRWEQQKVLGRDGSTAINLNDNYSPRLGMIWDVANNGRSKLYANYGRFYESVPMDINIRAFGGEIQCFCYNFSDNPADILADPTAPRRSSLLGGSTEPVDPDLKGQYIDEYILGYDWEAAQNFAIGVKGTYRNLGRVIEDFLVPSLGNYFIANPGSGIGKEMGFYDGSSVAAPDAKRKYTGIEFNARKRFSNNYQFFASYLWSKLEGNYDGVFQASTGQLDPNINSAFDYADFMINSDGKLSNDRTHQLKFDGSYIFTGALNGLTIGASARYASGTPITAYGYSFAYSNWEYYLTPRGELGRNPADWEADLHFGYPVKMGPTELNFLVDVFNVFNRQAITSYDQRYNLNSDDACAGIPEDICNGDGGLLHNGATLEPVGQLSDPRATATNPDFLNKGTAFTQPRSIRVGLRLSF